MKFSMDRYQFEVSDNKVIATSMHAGKPVSGVAKCDPDDEFILDAGKKLAAARCNEKVYKKRMKQARKKLKNAIAAQQEYKNRINKAYKKFHKAKDAYDKAVTFTCMVKSSL